MVGSRPHSLGRPAGQPAGPLGLGRPPARPASRPASRPPAGQLGPTGRLMPARRPAADRPRQAAWRAAAPSPGSPPPPICSLLFINGAQSSLFLEPPTARGKLRSHTIERSDARICYRTAQPRFRWCKRRRTALRSPETSSSAERKSWDFHRKVGFEWMTHRGQNASGGPASTHEILIPCAGLPAPPLQSYTCILYRDRG